MNGSVTASDSDGIPDMAEIHCILVCRARAGLYCCSALTVWRRADSLGARELSAAVADEWSGRADNDKDQNETET